MRTFTSLLLGCSLALAGAAFAQQPEESPAKGKKQGKETTTQQAEPKTPKTQGATGEQGAEKGHRGKAANATGAETNVSGQPGGTPANEPGVGKGHKGKAATGAETNVSGQPGGIPANEPGAGKGHKAKAIEKSTTITGTETNVSGEPAATTAPGVKEHGKGKNARGANAMTSPSVAPPTATASAAPNVKERGKGKNAGGANANASPSVAPSVAATGQTNATAGGATAHVEKQKVEQVKQQTAQIKEQHVNFHAEPRPDKAPAVTFNANFRLEGSDRWQGPQYEVYRSYHPERHDRGWYHSHFTRVELIGGGYYYWNNGYWYPAWGYDSGNEYYAYDAPIYVGHRAEPPDRVIADVQAELQEMGYYQGEVDGLLGPLTRRALTDYQADQGLQVTAVIDEPTLDSLGMG
jgi:hypothetical protein